MCDEVNCRIDPDDADCTLRGTGVKGDGVAMSMSDQTQKIPS